MGITNKVLEAQIAAGQGFEQTTRKVSERIAKYDESSFSHEQMIKDLNAGKISAYDVDGVCFFCARGDYHWLFSLDAATFGSKKKCGGAQEAGYICVDDQRARGILSLKEAMDAQASFSRTEDYTEEELAKMHQVQPHPVTTDKVIVDKPSST